MYCCWYKTKKHKFPLSVLDFLMPVPVMTRANTDTEPKYQNANTGTGTIVECQYRSWTVPLPILNQSTEMTVLVQAPFLDASSGNGLCLYWY
jgi:hypothetical protein